MPYKQQLMQIYNKAEHYFTYSTMTCNACNQMIYDKHMFRTSPDNKVWHSSCLKCSKCHKLLESKYFETSGGLFCHDDYLVHFGPSCFVCAAKISNEQYFFSIKQAFQKVIDPLLGTPQTQYRQLFFHDKCFTCNFCSVPLRKGDKYCLMNSSQNTLVISHEICTTNLQATQPPTRGKNGLATTRGRRGRMKQKF